MQHVITSFDYRRYPPAPLQSILVGKENKFFTFYKPGTGLKVKEILENVKTFKEIIVVDDTLLNDCKSHISAFGFGIDSKIHDLCMPRINMLPSSSLIEIMRNVRNRKLSKWRELFAKASVVYDYLENKGVKHGFKRVPVQYSLETFTGRSKTLGFNLQGTTDEFDIKPIDNFGCFVHFDWIGADFVMAAHMSGDKDLQNSFINSDPYSRLMEMCNTPGYDRSKCKKDFLSAIYALRFNDPIIAFYPTLRNWMIMRKEKMLADGYLDSIMGRRFHIHDGNELSVFNAQFQGSVAHAMQAALVKLYMEYKENLLTEVHDSIVMVCNEVDLIDLINGVAGIITNPLAGWCENPPFMPLKISIGRHWKKWKKFREFRQR